MDEVIELTKNWIKKAENDLKTAKDELSTEDPATDTICFHAQQCAEKYLKSYLIFHQKQFGRTHIIARLVELCRGLDPGFEEILDFDAGILSSYAVEARYDENFFPPENEAEDAVNIAEKVKKFVLARLEDSGFTR